MQRNSSDAEQPANEKIEFSGYEGVKIPPGLETKTIQALRNKGLLSSAYHMKRTLLKITVSIVLLTGIFYAGWMLGKTNNKPASNISAGDQSFLLLLYNPADFVTSAAHAKEYGDWMYSLASDKQVISGDELQKAGWQISMLNNTLQINNQPVSNSNGKISGFFLINAPDEKKALEIAASCPHIRHKGMIELRPVQSHRKS